MDRAKYLLNQIGETEFQFTLIKPDGEILLTSVAYTDKTTCERAIKLIKENAGSEEIYDKKKSPRDHYYFDVKLANNELVATSNAFVDKEELNKNIEEVIKYAREAEVDY